MLSRWTALLSVLSLPERKLSVDNVVNTQLGFRDFTNKVQIHFELAALDPGRTHMITAAFGSANGSHQVRRRSSAEYYRMTGSSQRNRL